MSKKKRLYVLIALLAVLCAATFALSHTTKKKEQIKESGETILSIDPENTSAFSWKIDSSEFSFHKDEDGNWVSDADEAFPVNQDKVNTLLANFENYGAAFTIDEVDDLSQYGLDDPYGTISITCDDTSTEIKLGNFSTMDEKRYLSIGDDKVYLAVNDPYDFLVLDESDLFAYDQIPSFSSVNSITFAGSENYTINYNLSGDKAYSDDDVYETDDNRILDASKVSSYLTTVKSLDISDYVTYKADDEALASYGLDDPALTLTIAYTADDQDESFSLTAACDEEEYENALKETEEDSESTALDDLEAYVKIGDSPIVYRITGSDYQELLAVSYNDLRHKEVFVPDFEEITSMEITLEGESYTIKAEGSGDDITYTCGDDEIEIDDLESALTNLTYSDFTTDAEEGKKEISLTIKLDNANYPEISLAFYRVDGKSCLVKVDGEAVGLVNRAALVTLTEAVNAIVLN